MQLEQLKTDYESLSMRLSALENPMDLTSLTQQYAELNRRITALERPPTPTGRIKVSNFELLGGWRIPGPFARGGLAIDWARNRIITSGPANENWIYEYNMPPMGIGTDVSSWPSTDWPVGRHENFWGDNIWDVPNNIGWGKGYSGGIRLIDNVLWVSTKVWYESQPQELVLYGKNLTTGMVERRPTGLSQPAFGGGFIKGHAEYLLGCGGCESSQDSAYGPTCAKEDGTILLDQARFNNGTWEVRTPRPPNYSIKPPRVDERYTDGRIYTEPEWMGIEPRNGEGRWCADRVHGGGLWLPNGLCYWVLLGTGVLSYRHQTEVFSIGDNKECWLYTYDPNTFAWGSVAFEQWEHGMVQGIEVGPDGLIYLHTRDQWASGLYKVDSAIKVFRLK